MKLNVGVPNSMHVAAMVQPWEYKLTGADIGEAMKVADELGYNKCMLGEHFIVPQSHIELSGDHYFHTTVALGYIGGQPKQMKLSSSVSILPLQNPMVHAKAWSTLDHSEEHTSELQSLMRISYAVFRLKKKNIHSVLTIGDISYENIDIHK